MDEGGLRRLELATEDGERLDAEVAAPAEPRAGVVLAHPHPQFGGSMHVPLIEALFQALPDAGVAALRFDFRGVGRSSGSHDGGDGEHHDVRAAVGALAGRLDGGHLVTAGWSFGGDVSLGVLDEALDGWVGIAAPLQLPGHDGAGTDPRPTLLLVPEHDQLNPPDVARATTAEWTNTRLEVIPSTDHSLLGRSGWVVERLLGFVDELR